MKQLSREEIQFINAYLKKSEVIYDDVRAELVDHIASAVEDKIDQENLAFYDAFKDFMIHNKKEILKKRNYFLPSILSFGKTLYKPYNLVLGVLICILFYLLPQFIDGQKILQKIHLFLFYGMWIFVFFQAIYIYVISKKRFIYLEKTTFSLMAIYYVNLFSNGFYTDFYGNSITLGITFFLFLTFLIYYILTVIKFKEKYSFLGN
ncbi:hypothetical protein [uncultured Flavobacterium sp.]|uniref:hypothetical protein n=1 Tax=uncultured Flavobacterium sp. TaxID=165435 RepID=UPI0025F4668E|nr:hypothetical protein [uncultured Flavobacterium sp.]